MEGPAVRLSVIIPVYNEEALLAPNTCRLLRLLLREGLSGEVILGSNGSTDATARLGAWLEGEFPGLVRFFHLPGRGAVGRVFARAARMAAGDLLVSCDMDLSVDLGFIARAAGLLSECEAVAGSKIAGGQKRPWYRRLGSRAFIVCAQRLLGLAADDFSMAAKAFRREAVLPHLSGLSPDSNYVVDLMWALAREGGRIEVVPVACEDRRRSRFSLPCEAARRFSHLVALWWRGRGAGPAHFSSRCVTASQPGPGGEAPRASQRRM